MKGRRGGALFPVLLLMGVLVFLGAMIPQVLVQASMGIRQDRARDALVVALESGIAFAEARLKRDLESALTLADEAKIPPFTIKPSFENPDFGKKRDFDWEARLVRTTLFDTIQREKDPVKTFVYAYRIQAKARGTRPNGPTLGNEVNGLISVRVLIDKGQSGVAIRTVEGVSFQAMGSEHRNLAFATPGPP